mmetsp:Transcript_106830/g.184283  ORF Transcript_106830/g.184283 Transcript_106830/m.184283 type:complete len:89 (+) Transcript_106830:311-577(+)
MDEPAIQAKINAMGLDAAEHVLNHETSQTQLRDMFRSVFAQRELQLDVGDALWNATWYSITPNILRGKKKQDDSSSSVDTPSSGPVAA